MDSWCQFLEDLEVRSGVEETMLISSCLHDKNVVPHQISLIGVMLVTVHIKVFHRKECFTMGHGSTCFIDLQQHMIIYFLGNKFRKEFYPQLMW